MSRCLDGGYTVPKVVTPERLPSGSFRLRVGGGKRKDGTYRVVTRVLPGTSTPQDLRMAELQMRAEVDSTTPNSTLITLIEAVYQYISYGESADHSPKTTKEYQGLARRWLLEYDIASVALANLTTSRIDRHYREICNYNNAQKVDGKVGPVTVRRLHSLISGSLKMAVAHGLIRDNPASSCMAVPKQKRRSTITATNPAEYREVVEATEALELRALIRFIGSTGVRKSEALALRWSDIEIAPTGVQARINGALSDVGGVHRKDTKTHQHRTVAAGITVASELAEIRSQQREACKALRHSTWAETHYVWSRGGAGIQPLRPDTAGKAITKTGVNAGELRHMVATQLIAAGMSPVDVAAILGHASAKMTLDVYAQPVPGRLARAVEIMSGE